MREYDKFSDCDITRLLDSHKRSAKDVTLVVYKDKIESMPFLNNIVNEFIQSKSREERIGYSHDYDAYLDEHVEDDVINLLYGTIIAGEDWFEYRIVFGHHICHAAHKDPIWKFYEHPKIKWLSKIV